MVNGYLFLLMFLSRDQDQQSNWVVPDWQFLLLGVVGGGLGGLLGQWVFNQKKDKLRYKVCFILGAILSGLLLLSTYAK
nr:DUF1294 domain-containing protein [Vagococcus allomyrinae]